jgi:hypothetical protein
LDRLAQRREGQFGIDVFGDFLADYLAREQIQDDRQIQGRRIHPIIVPRIQSSKLWGSTRTFERDLNTTKRPATAPSFEWVAEVVHIELPVVVE